MMAHYIIIFYLKRLGTSLNWGASWEIEFYKSMSFAILYNVLVPLLSMRNLFYYCQFLSITNISDYEES